MELRPLEAADARPILQLPLANRDHLARPSPTATTPTRLPELAWRDLGLQHPLWEKLEDD